MQTCETVYDDKCRWPVIADNSHTMFIFTVDESKSTSLLSGWMSAFYYSSTSLSTVSANDEQEIGK